jgi:hypothetical protein
MEKFPVEAPKGVDVSILEFAAVFTTLTLSSMGALRADAGLTAEEAAGPLADEEEGGEMATSASSMLGLVLPEAEPEAEDLQSPSALAFVDQNMRSRARLEQEVERELLAKVKAATVALPTSAPPSPTEMGGREWRRPDLQVWTCIDERECSIRRHLEAAVDEADGHPMLVETFGVAGFFDFPIRFLGAGVLAATLAPEGAAHAHVVTEEREPGAATMAYEKCHRRMARLSRWWEGACSSPLGALSVQAVLCPLNFLYLLVMSWLPGLKRSLTDFAFDTVLVGKPPPTAVS